MISRIFYPIGQGAFYAERHDTFNVVYDCGNWKQTNLSKKVVSQSFAANESVKMLFISHLDWDHISLLETLKNTVSSIDYVVLPLLYKNQKIFLGNIHRILGHSSLTIIRNPERFFGETAKIIYIAPSENNEINDNSINIDDNSENKNIQEIASGTTIKISGDDYNWCFIPFNIKNTQRSKILEEELEKAGFDVEKLKTDPSYTITKLTTKKDKNIIKNIYNSLHGKINENSLVIYSGPRNKRSDSIWHSYFSDNIYFSHSVISGKIGCIYTGDVNLNKLNITKIYGKQWNMVGTIQI
ncbi:hypothetical protein FQO94_21340, partial [Salmonella enterica]|nr:hypothetical protein [Salmonella enterica]